MINQHVHALVKIHILTHKLITVYNVLMDLF
jgi:hypothetical protein